MVASRGGGECYNSWSDDRCDVAQQRTVDDDDGIVLPDLLQALLGVDFVPYLSSCNGRSGVPCLRKSPSTSTLSSTLFEGDETLIDSLEQATSEPITVERKFQTFTIDTARNALLEQSAALVTPNRQKKPRSKISSIVKGIKRRVITPRINIPKQSFHEEKTPKRRGRASSPPPTETPVLDAWEEQQRLLVAHEARLAAFQQEAGAVKERAALIETRMSQLLSEAARLRQAWEGSASELEREAASLQSTKQALSRLDAEADAVLEESVLEAMRWASPRQSEDPLKKPPRKSRSMTVDNGVPLSPPLVLTTSTEVSVESASPTRPRANTAPQRLNQSRCSSFMRTNDLDLDSSTSSLSFSIHSSTTSPLNKQLSVDELFFLDNNICLILDHLFQLGYQVATDESDRFQPTRETQRILQSRGSMQRAYDEGPEHPWNAAEGIDVLTWIGSANHNGIGHDWPVTKARGFVATTARELVHFLLDSANVPRYNKMSQGRHDVVTLQEGIDTTANDSEYGFAGTAKIVRALVKPMMLPKTIEMLSLLYARPLGNDSYMIVSRSVWEDNSVMIPKNNNSNNLLRSEMLLGVQLVRPVSPGGCELTTITHVLSPGVAEALAKRLAPNNATSLIREIQAIFRSSS